MHNTVFPRVAVMLSAVFFTAISYMLIFILVLKSMSLVVPEHDILDKRQAIRIGQHYPAANHLF